jgi:hypothetical protein
VPTFTPSGTFYGTGHPLGEGDILAISPSGSQVLTYTEDSVTNFPNPDRGWYEYMENSNWYGSSGSSVWGAKPPTNSYIAAVHPESVRLGMRYVRLDDFRDATIPQWVLDSLDDEFTAWRNTGMKAILRFAYNRSATDDAPYARVIEHINQLSPLLHKHADVIALLQTGLVGAFGEWWGSTNDLLTNPSYRNGIIQALFDATPSTMMIDHRNPGYLIHFWGLDTALAYEDRFNGSDRARHGHKNDAWATSEHMTTYTGWESGGAWTGEDERAWIAAQSTYTSMGGETDMYTLEGGVVNQWSDYEWIKGQKTLLHMDYLSSDWYEGILNKWGQQGHIAEFSRRLGYRLHLERVDAPTSVTPNAGMTVTLRMANTGFGKVFNPRPIDLVFVGSGGPFAARLTADARRDLPLAGEVVDMEYTFTAPAALQSGASYALHLALPDPDLKGNGLDADSRYAIRLANTGGLWDGGTGWHALGMNVTIN